MDLTRRKLLDQLIAEAAAEPPDDAHPSELTDEQLLASLRAHRYEAPRAGGTVVDPTEGPSALYAAYLAALSDDELIAEHERLTATMEQKRRREPEVIPPPNVEPANVEPPTEPHPVALEEPKPAPPSLTPRQEWDRKQREIAAELVREGMEAATRRGEAMRRDSERPSTYDGPMFGSDV